MVEVCTIPSADAVLNGFHSAGEVGRALHVFEIDEPRSALMMFSARPLASWTTNRPSINAAAKVPCGQGTPQVQRKWTIKRRWPEICFSWNEGVKAWFSSKAAVASVAHQRVEVRRAAVTVAFRDSSPM